MEASTGDDKPVPERYDVEQAGGDSDDDEPDWLSAAGEDVGMSPASSRGDLRSKYTPGGGTGESVSQCTTRSSSTRSAYHSANDEKSESPEPARITINRLPPRRGKKPTSQAKPLDAELFSEKFESLEHEASCSSSAAAFSPMSATTTDSPSTAFRPISLGEGTPQVLLEAVPAEELPRSTSAADAEFADWANWEQANVGGSLDGGGMDAYASTPLPPPPPASSPLARREVERKAAEEMAKRTYASWDTIDDFNPRAGESDSPPPAGAEFGDEEMAGGAASKSRRTRSATASQRRRRRSGPWRVRQPLRPAAPAFRCRRIAQERARVPIRPRSRRQGWTMLPAAAPSVAALACRLRLRPGSHSLLSHGRSRALAEISTSHRARSRRGLCGPSVCAQPREI